MELPEWGAMDFLNSEVITSKPHLTSWIFSVKPRDLRAWLVTIQKINLDLALILGCSNNSKSLCCASENHQETSQLSPLLLAASAAGVAKGQSPARSERSTKDFTWNGCHSETEDQCWKRIFSHSENDLQAVTSISISIIIYQILSDSIRFYQFLSDSISLYVYIWRSLKKMTQPPK